MGRNLRIVKLQPAETGAETLPKLPREYSNAHYESTAVKASLLSDMAAGTLGADFANREQLRRKIVSYLPQTALTALNAQDGVASEAEK